MICQITGKDLITLIIYWMKKVIQISIITVTKKIKMKILRCLKKFNIRKTPLKHLRLQSNQSRFQL